MINNSNLQSLNEAFFKDEVNEFIKSYYDFKKELSVLETENNVENYQDASLGKTITILENTFSTIKENLNKLKNISFSNYTLPIDVNGKNIDLVEVILEIYDKKTNDLIDTYSYRVWITGGFKIDFSGGLFFSSLLDDKFYTKDDLTEGNEGKKFIRQKDLGNLDYGFGTLMNLKYRSEKNYSYLFSFGALLKEAQEFQFLAGLGISFGKDERIILSTGVTLGRVERLVGDYDANTSYLLPENNLVTTEERFGVGYFFGVSYNLNKPKKDAD
ncbi:hypothetical protein JL193_03030 [Polaribacter batillariae]|uniref:Outer membrane protein beta-barrel domain-containing protein n=1 Tax=Polaribacter batillariae TaxID=2808900 RepID=A0ABX7SVN1_9FLAO|nr:hypothetical protein [Polaribacter batillariae]QTD38290.1 hypothetical protein JL193_03030 [Polaribacter batillariae]